MDGSTLKTGQPEVTTPIPNEGAAVEAPSPRVSLFDPARLRFSQQFQAGTGVKKRLTLVQVRKPNKQDFVRVHPAPEFRLETAVLEFKEEGETYLVDPGLWQDLPGELVPKILYLSVTRQNVIRLWPIRLPDDEGKLDDWNQSALAAAEIAKTRWVRVSANRALGAYETFEAMGDLPDPEWPDISFQNILEIAFKGKYIEDWDHPALRRLRGED